MTKKSKIFVTCGILLGTVIISSLTSVLSIHYLVNEDVKIEASTLKAKVGETVKLEAKIKKFWPHDELTYQWFEKEGTKEKLISDEKELDITSKEIGKKTFTLKLHSKKYDKDYTKEISIEWEN